MEDARIMTMTYFPYSWSLNLESLGLIKTFSITYNAFHGLIIATVWIPPISTIFETLSANDTDPLINNHPKYSEYWMN